MDEFAFDDDTGTNLPTPPQSENVVQAAKTRDARPRVSATGVKARAKRTSGGAAQKAGVTKAKGKREALADISNTRDIGSDTEEVDDFDELNEAGALATTSAAHMASKKTAENKKKPGRPPKSGTKQNVGAAIVEAPKDEIPETQVEDVFATSNLARTKTKARAGAPPPPSRRKALVESQAEPMDLDESAIQGADKTNDRNPPPQGGNSAQSTSIPRQRQNSVPRRRAGSASDTERGTNDPMLRRKLGDMTRKFEDLEVKYNDLRDVGVAEAERNFDKLRKKTDEKTKAANELIASLRAELAAQKAAAAEARALRDEIATLESQNETLASEKKSLVASLNDAQNETKTLHAKLAATRSTSNPAPYPGVPSNKAGATKTVLVSNAEAAKEAQKRLLKEDLYSDLTGLILLDVRRREEESEDVYDCIQTGRNGTLHFHLTISDPSGTSNSKTPGASNTSYQDAEFQYTPLLDEKRDKDLLEILPDYLTEEICFPRSNAAKFYSRVVDCMTKKVELVED